MPTNPMPSWAELVKMLALVADMEFHHPPLSITIRFSDSARPITIPVDRIVASRGDFVHGPMDSATPPPLSPSQVEPIGSSDKDPLSHEDHERGPIVHRCVREIMATIREVGRPLTKTRLLEEMSRRGYEWSERTVCKFLKILMEEGTLANPEDAKVRGYRIADEQPTSDE